MGRWDDGGQGEREERKRDAGDIKDKIRRLMRGRRWQGRIQRVAGIRK
jgi:hypothetical protein